MSTDLFRINDDDQLAFSGDSYNLEYNDEGGIEYGDEGVVSGGFTLSIPDESEDSSVSETTGTSEGQINTPPHETFVKSEFDRPSPNVAYCVLPESRSVRPHHDSSSSEVLPKKERRRGDGVNIGVSSSGAASQTAAELRKEKNRQSSALSRQRQKEYTLGLHDLTEDQKKQIVFLTNQRDALLKYTHELQNILVSCGKTVPPLPEIMNESYVSKVSEPKPPPNFLRPPKPPRTVAVRGTNSARNSSGHQNPVYTPPVPAPVSDSYPEDVFSGGSRRNFFGAGLCVFALVLTVGYVCHSTLQPEPPAATTMGTAGTTRVNMTTLSTATLGRVPEVTQLPSLSQRVVLSTKEEEQQQQQQQQREQEMSDLSTESRLALAPSEEDKNGLVTRREKEPALPMIPDVQPHIASNSWKPHNVPYLVVNSAQAYTPSKYESLSSESMRLSSSLGIIVPATTLNISGTNPGSLVELYCTVQEANIIPAGKTTKPGY